MKFDKVANDMISSAQLRLAALGLYAGEPDGIMGPITSHAIAKFQKLHDIVGSGQLTDLTIAKIKQESSPITARTSGEYGHGTDSVIVAASHKASFAEIPLASEMDAAYGTPGDHDQMGKINLPYSMALAWKRETRINRFTIHTKCIPSLTAIFTAVALKYSATEISDYGFDLFGGGLAVRKQRGGTRWSTHAYGAAIDIDSARNQLRWRADRGDNKPFLSRPECRDFIDIFYAHGWISLGLETGFDWMHFQRTRGI